MRAHTHTPFPILPLLRLQLVEGEDTPQPSPPPQPPCRLCTFMLGRSAAIAPASYLANQPTH